MNEVTRIHLGRQPFTVSVDAHRALKAYLAEIKKQTSDKSVVDEVELRMAELLTERGVTGEKVMLESDVDFLKSQLGNPDDFKEDSEAQKHSSDIELASKRLFRDTDNAMIAGVAAGLANFFGLSVLSVRILIIVITIFTSGGGILIYIALWLLVPPAKTSSDKLQMQGKPVTVDALKEVVDRADFKGAAERANSTFSPVVSRVLAITLKIIGVGFILSGLVALFGLIAAKVYMLAHDGRLFQENIFPVGTSEQLLMNIGLFLAGIVALFGILTGMAFFKRKWPISSWITGALVGLFFVGLASGIALASEAAPKVRDRYRSATQVIVKDNLEPFDRVKVIGADVEVAYVYAPKYSVSMRYFDSPNVSKVDIEVVGKTLQLDFGGLDNERYCEMLCMFPNYFSEITVSGPEFRSIDYPEGAPFAPRNFHNP